jgi:hypothetical protein
MATDAGLIRLISQSFYPETGGYPRFRGDMLLGDSA